MTTTVMQAPAGVVGQVQTAYGNYTIGSNGQVTVDSRAVGALEGAGFTSMDTNYVSGAHTITADEATAGEAVIDTGLTAITSHIVQVLTAADVVGTLDAVITASGGDLTVADGATYDTDEGAVIHWIAFGY